MTHTTIVQLTAPGRDAAKWNDLIWRLGRVKAAFDAATGEERKRLGELGRKLCAERDAMRGAR